MAHFSGQLEHTILTLEQVKCLSVVERNEVFWAFSPKEGHTVAEIAQRVERTAPTVHYHTAALLKVGLLMPVGTQRKRSRTETLYAWAMANFSRDLAQSEAYREYSVEAFRAVARVMVREVETVMESANEDLSELQATYFRHFHLHLTEEEALELRQEMSGVLQRAIDRQSVRPGTRRYHVVMTMNPAIKGREE